MSTTPAWPDGLTFGDVLDRTAERFGDRDAPVFPQQNTRCNYREFRSQVRRLARALLALGVQRSEHVGIWATNRPQWVLTQFAAAHIGAVLVNINPAYRAQELEYVLNQADIATLLLTDRFKSSDYFALLQGLCPELAGAPGRLCSARCPTLRRVISIKNSKLPGMLSWAELLEHAGGVTEAELDRARLETAADDVVNIQYTSGTTGFPKGAMLSHRNLLMNAYHVGQRLGFHRARPALHSGAVLSLFRLRAGHAAAPRSTARRWSFRPKSFDPLATLEAIQDERATARLRRADHVHRRAATTRASPSSTCAACAPASWPAAPARSRSCGRSSSAWARGEITIGYGLTEASPIITQTATPTPWSTASAPSAGRCPGVEVKHRRCRARGEPLRRRRAGRVVCRGHGIMNGYYHKPAETAAAIDAGRLAAHRRPGACDCPTATTASPAGSRT